MRRRTRVALVAVGGLIVLVLAAAVIVPRLIDLGPVRSAIVSQVSQRLGATVSLGSLQFALLPVPHVNVGDVTFAVPNVANGTIGLIAVRPHLLSLLRGRIDVAKLQVNDANVNVTVAPAPAATAPASEKPSPTVGEALAAALGGIASVGQAVGPGTAVVVKDARVNLTGLGPPISLSQLNARARLSPDHLQAELTLQSTLAEHVTLHLTADTAHASATADLDIQHLHPQIATATLLPPPWPQVKAAEIDLQTHVSARTPTAWDVTVRGSWPKLAIESSGRSLALGSAHFDAAVSADASTMTVTLTGLDLDAPRAHLSGHFINDPASSKAEFEVDGKDVDVAAVGAAATGFAPDVAIVKSLFDVLRGGIASTVTVRAAAPTMAGLGDAVAVKGTLTAGRLHIPGIELDLEDVNGDAVVVDNVLEGAHASARVGTTRASDGSLRLGLSGNAQELALEAAVQSDAADVPPLLQHLVRTGPLLGVLNRLTNIGGTVGGKFRLSGTTNDVAVLVDVSQIDITGRYQGLDLPLQLAGGSVSFAPDGISADGLTVSVGSSQFGATHVQIDRRGQVSVAVGCGASRIVLDELYPKIRTAGWLGDGRGVPDSLTGTILGESLSFSGPVDTPAAWQWSLQGAIQNLEISSALFREHVAVREPLTMTGVRFSHDSAATAFAGKISAPGGLTGDVDVAWSADKVDLRRLQIRDQFSDATLTLLLQQRKVTTSFSGHLLRATVAALVPNLRVLDGKISGNFRAEIPLDRPANTAIQGRLVAEGVVLPGREGARWTIEQLSVQSAANRAAAVRATVDLATDGRFTLDGTVSAAQGALVVNGTLASPHLDVETLAATVAHRDTATDHPAAQSILPNARGVLHVNVDTLTYGALAWKPFRATVNFGPGGTSVNVTQANLCGISTPGIVSFTGGLSLTVKPSATNAALDGTLACLFNRPGLATGAYTLSGTISAHGDAEHLTASLQGPVSFSATKGQVQRVPIIANTFSVLSLATGSLENIFSIGQTSLPYDQASLQGHLHNGILTLSQLVVNGPTVKMAAEGSIDLANGTVDLTLLVAPLVAADNLIAKIPLIGGLVGGNIVSIPVRVTGPLRNPSAVPMSPTAVGQTLMALMKRTMALPVRAFDLWSR